MSARQQQLWSGVLFIVIGGGAFLLSLQYNMWVGRQVGSGLFPAGLGLILTAIGIVVALQSLSASGEGSGPWNMRPILAICLSLVAFALLIDRIGTLGSLAVAALVAGLAGRPNFKYLAIVYVLISAFVYFFLIKVIKLPYRLF